MRAGFTPDTSVIVAPPSAPALSPATLEARGIAKSLLALRVPPRPALLAFLLDLPCLAARGLGDSGFIPLLAPLAPKMAALPVVIGPVRCRAPVLDGVHHLGRRHRHGGRSRRAVGRGESDQAQRCDSHQRHRGPTHENLLRALLSFPR